MLLLIVHCCAPLLLLRLLLLTTAAKLLLLLLLLLTLYSSPAARGKLPLLILPHGRPEREPNPPRAAEIDEGVEVARRGVALHAPAGALEADVQRRRRIVDVHAQVARVCRLHVQVGGVCGGFVLGGAGGEC